MTDPSLSRRYRMARSRRAKMTLMSRSMAGLAVIALIVPALTHAAEVSVGQREYEDKCAMCHGSAGGGDGWFSAYLKRPPSSLATLRRNNGGVFPFDRIHQVVDGRKEVQVHGPRDMPVWGDVYRMEPATIWGTPLEGVISDDRMVRARILALIEYISRLQQ